MFWAEPLLGCYPSPEPNNTSGEKGCPIHPYTVQDNSNNATCLPCGECPCCTGFCLWDWHCSECGLGQQGPDLSTVTVENNKIFEAYQATENSCSQECDDGGSIEQCYNCVAGIVPNFSLYCIKCLPPILPKILECLRNNPEDPTEALDCILTSPVPASCTDCICDILCHIEPSLCKLCHDSR